MQNDHSNHLARIHISSLNKERLPHEVNLTDEENIKQSLLKCFHYEEKIEKIEVIIDTHLSQSNPKFLCKINLISSNLGSFSISGEDNDYAQAVRAAVDKTVDLVKREKAKKVDKNHHRNG